MEDDTLTRLFVVEAGFQPRLSAPDNVRAYRGVGSSPKEALRSAIHLASAFGYEPTADINRRLDEMSLIQHIDEEVARYETYILVLEGSKRLDNAPACEACGK